MDLMWAPGQSDAAKEIGRHLTKREKAGLVGLALLFALCAFALPVVLMGAAFGIGPVQVSLGGLAFPVLMCLAAGVVGSLMLQRRLLLSTRFAKENGITLADITARTPLARKDYLILGLFAGLAVAVAMATATVAFII